MSSRRWGGVWLALGASLVFALPMTACEGDDVSFTPPPFDPDSGTFGAPDATTPVSVDSGTDAADADVPAPDAGSDASVAAACDDGKIDPGELCDPLASCPTSCAPAGCQLRELQNAGTCTAKCVDTKLQDACINADGCCPPGCNANNDDDCKVTCGNGTVEGGETCDPLGSCPTACGAIGCQLRKLEGAGTCGAKCVDDKLQTACVSGDQCCPAGCNANNDDDCKPGCGNNVVENNETCDPLASCPRACPQLGCQLRDLKNPGTCQAECVNAGMQTACVNDDGCCPEGCNANNDNDCQPKCGNSVVEKGETCDPLTSCPQSCPQIGCNLQALKGAGTCQAACVAAGQQEKCVSNDGCCPKGCNANTDNDCKAICGNSVVEPGETCDPSTACVTNCEAETYSCFTSTGSAATCNFACHQPSACGTNEVKLKQPACCPYGKGGSCGEKQDPNCAGSSWKFITWPKDVSTSKGCTLLTLSGMAYGGSYEITTCAPPKTTPGEGDTFIQAVTDDGKNSYAVGNDNCTDGAALPLLAGWTCKNKLGERLSCASPSPGGFIYTNKDGKGLSFQVCGTGVGAGTTPVYIWYNAPDAPVPVLK